VRLTCCRTGLAFPLFLLFVVWIQPSSGAGWAVVERCWSSLGCPPAGRDRSSACARFCCGSVEPILFVAGADLSMTASLAMKGCIAVCTAAVRATTSRVGISGGVASGTLGSGVNVAARVGCGAEPEMVRFFPVMGVGREGGMVDGFPMVSPSSSAVLQKRSILRSRRVLLRVPSSCCCLIVS
jgi:hypothetical protein